MTWVSRIKRQAGYLALVLLVAVPASHSLARTCASSGVEAARLQRQIATNRTMAHKHGCDLEIGGFVCREVAGRIAQARAALSALPSACKADGRATHAAISPKRVIRQLAKAEASTARPALSAATRVATFCVRLSDGYYFPTPNSGFSPRRASIEGLAAQCRAICATANMDVFQQPRGNGEPMDMVSLSTGRRYRDLDVAGLYRKAEQAKTCDASRIFSADFRPMSAASMPATAPQNGSEAAPDRGPTVLATLEGSPDKGLFSDVGLRGTRTDIPRFPRKVRMVGPAFLPDL
ncbi:DUF2865 domain-containing protein [Rhizobium sp. Leaf384]|uniref:DUF2865 domain-containing protein n=1 Tax=Rhizobium sp. Leaf384 TaxID=1736358 RepID=UPI000B279288|nr:DUF2865 domain-containing protein [Rhizobium sp. Leaf384]